MWKHFFRSLLYVYSTTLATSHNVIAKQYKTHFTTHTRQDEVLTRKTLCSHKKDFSGSAIKTTTSVAPRTQSYLHEKASAAWKSTKQPHSRCEKHDKLAKMRAVKDLLFFKRPPSLLVVAMGARLME